jgi:hypothetical protein
VIPALEQPVLPGSEGLAPQGVRSAGGSVSDLTDEVKDGTLLLSAMADA